MAIAVIVANAFFAAMSGASIAASAMFARIAVPEMKKRGYDTGLACGVVAGAGPIAAMIPPSGVMVIYCLLADVALGKQLIAGIIPGIITVMIMALITVSRCSWKPSLAPPVSGATWKERFTSLAAVGPVLLIILSILGTIYLGIATPTEAAALGALATALICIAKRRLSWRSLYNALINTVLIGGMMTILFVGGRVFGSMVTVGGLPRAVTELMAGLAVPPIVIIILFIAMYLVMGCFIDNITMMVLTLPIVMPVIYLLGYSGIWFGILVVSAIEIGGLTPPFGVCLFATKSGLIGTTAEDISIGEIARGMIPFMMSYLIALAIFIAFPSISLFLPGLMMG
jgi:tripartite ATP-independent transporter DctM subunit